MRQDRLGVYFYTGTTQTGKTKRALADAWADRDATTWPILVIDSQGVWNFRQWEHVETVRDACLALWPPEDEQGRPLYPARNVAFIPQDESQVDQLFRGVRAGRRVIVVIDEARFWLSKRRISDDVSRALRVWAHSELILRFTTQRVADIHNDAMACHREIHVFRTVDPADLERLRTEYGVDPARAKGLRPDSGGQEPDGEFLTIRWAELQGEGVKDAG